VGKAFEFQGYLDDSTGRREVRIWVKEARQTTEHPDFYCEIGGSLFGQPVKVFGEDAGQAKQLAFTVLRKRLTGRQLIDSTGSPIKAGALFGE
jgi:hypothetical protein